VNPAVLDNHGHFGRLSGSARLEFPLVAPDIPPIADGAVVSIFEAVPSIRPETAFLPPLQQPQSCRYSEGWHGSGY